MTTTLPTTPVQSCNRQAFPTSSGFGRVVALLVVSIVAVLFLAQTAGAVAPADFYGLNTFDQLTSDQEAEEVERLGVKRVRLNVTWRDFQQSNCNDQVETGISWNNFDKKVRRAAEHGIEIIADLYGTRVPLESECPNGADLHEFPAPSTQLYKDFVFLEGGGYQGGFVWQVVQRYGQNGSFWYANPDLTPHPIKIWEVWNETNFAENNPNNVVWPQGYGKLLVDTSAAIYFAQKALIGQDPENIGVRTLFGGLWADTHTGSGQSVYWTPTKYLDQIYNHPEGYTWNDIHYAYEGLSYHPYRLRGTAADVQTAIGGTVPMLQSFGEYDKELWITELGWPVDFNQISPSHNAQGVSNMLNSVLGWTWANRGYLHAEYAATFAYKDYPHLCFEAACWAFWTGIRDLDDKERPAWCAISNRINSNSCEFTSPAVATSSVSNLLPTQATLNGTVNPRGLKTSYHFTWGTPAEFEKDEYHFNPSPDAFVGWKKKTFSESWTLTELIPETTYEFRIVAKNSAGVGWTSNVSFKTPSE